MWGGNKQKPHRPVNWSAGTPGITIAMVWTGRGDRG
jgi:hypothetical protein